MEEFLSTSEKCQKASYEVAYLIAKDKKPDTIGETLIKPVAVANSQIMHGDKIADEVKEIPLSMTPFVDVSAKLVKVPSTN